MRVSVVVLACAAAMASAGCATSRRWADGATLLPDGARLRCAAVRAATDWRTWAPAAGAAVFGLSGLDRSVSRWASQRAPVFGSRDAAVAASDDLRDVARGLYAATVLGTPSGCGACEVALDKAKGVGVEAGALALTGSAAVGLKRATGRLRPDGSDRESFPSGHTAEAAALGALARRNAEVLCLPAGGEAVVDGAADGLTALTGWARVEAKKHYPSDVLAGWALANALTLFVHDAFLRDPAFDDVTLFAAPIDDGVMVAMSVDF